MRDIGGREKESGRMTSAAQQRIEIGESGYNVGSEQRAKRESVEHERMEKWKSMEEEGNGGGRRGGRHWRVKHEGKKKVRFFCFVFLVFLFLRAAYSSIPSVFFFKAQPTSLFYL